MVYRGLSYYALFSRVGDDDGGRARSAADYNRQVSLAAFIGRDESAALVSRSGNLDITHSHVLALPFVKSQHLRGRIRGGESEFAAFASGAIVAAVSLRAHGEGGL